MYYGERRGSAVTQAISRWFPTADRVRAQVRSCGICGCQSGTGATVSPANSHSTDCSTFIINYHPELVQ
jgi:hypothetical protein